MNATVAQPESMVLLSEATTASLPPESLGDVSGFAAESDTLLSVPASTGPCVEANSSPPHATKMEAPTKKAHVAFAYRIAR